MVLAVRSGAKHPFGCQLTRQVPLSGDIIGMVSQPHRFGGSVRNQSILLGCFRPPTEERWMWAQYSTGEMGTVEGDGQ